MSLTQHVSAMGVILRGLIAGVCAPFLVSGITKLINLDQASREMAGIGFTHPDAIAVIVVAVQLGGSVLAVCCRGAWAAAGALALATFTAWATLLAHAFWMFQAADRVAQMNTFAEHVSITFALLMVAWGHAKSSRSGAPKVSVQPPPEARAPIRRSRGERRAGT